MACELWEQYTDHVALLLSRSIATTTPYKTSSLRGVQRTAGLMRTDCCDGYLPQYEPNDNWQQTVERILSDKQTILLVPEFVWQEAEQSRPEPDPADYPLSREKHLTTGSICILRDHEGTDRAIVRITGIQTLTFARITEELVAGEGIYPSIGHWRKAK